MALGELVVERVQKHRMVDAHGGDVRGKLRLEVVTLGLLSKFNDAAGAVDLQANRIRSCESGRASGNTTRG